LSIHLSSWAEVLLVLAEAGFLFRVLTRPHREPASRLAWIIVIIALPLLGMIAYLMLGETRISGRRRSRGREIDARLPRPKGDESWLGQVQASPQQAPFALARSINALDPTSGNNARIAADSNVAIEEMVADIDAAKRHVHICTYIWLTDHNGLKVKDACIRAAERGVEVRILADALGSHRLIRSFHWNEMRDKGCHARVALPVGNPLWTLIRGRVDLRNHRKLLVIDNGIAWCGSQNIADPEFRIKPHYAPWVDIMTRWEGPAAQHCQLLFVSDWIAEGGEDISGLLSPASAPARTDGRIVAQVIGTGPTLSFDAMPACFSELIHSARQELVVTTPYFVPDEQLLQSGSNGRGWHWYSFSSSTGFDGGKKRRLHRVAARARRTTFNTCSSPTAVGLALEPRADSVHGDSDSPPSCPDCSAGKYWKRGKTRCSAR
jgi:cardiolipin synthase